MSVENLSAQDKEVLSMNEEAVKLAGEGKAAEAVAVYDKAIAASAEDGAGLAVVLTNRAVVLITLDKLDEAIADCTRAVKRDPKYEGAYQAHAKALACAGKLQQALDLLRSASKEQAFTGLNAVIAQLAAEQALETAVAKKDPARQKMNEYLNWLKQRGVDSSRVKVRMQDQRRTVTIATKDILAGDQVLFVPSSLVVLPANAADAPANTWLLWNAKVADRIPKEQRDLVSVALYYLHEKNNSKW